MTAKVKMPPRKPLVKKEPRRLVTVTAANYGGTAGWRAVIESTEAHVDRTGTFREPAGSVLEADVKAAACALALARSCELLGGEPAVLLQMRSLEAIGVILASDSRYSYSAGLYTQDQVIGRASHVPADCVAAVAAIRKVRDATKATLYVRLVAEQEVAA
jgi:hypothetical protein